MLLFAVSLVACGGSSSSPTAPNGNGGGAAITESGFAWTVDSLYVGTVPDSSTWVVIFRMHAPGNTATVTLESVGYDTTRHALVSALPYEKANKGTIGDPRYGITYYSVSGYLQFSNYRPPHGTFSGTFQSTNGATRSMSGTW